MHLIHAAVVLVVLFGAGVATSYAEKKFQYSLYETVIGLFKKKS